MKTCVLGHGWNEGQVLCPTCGFGPRTGQPELVSAAAPAAHAEVAPAAPVAPAPLVDDRPRSEDGSWVWDGSAWEPAEGLVPLVPAQATSPDSNADTHPARARAPRGRPSRRALLVGVLLLVVAAVVGAYALGLGPFGSSSGSTAPVAPAQHATGAAARDAFVRSVLTGGAKSEAAFHAKEGRYARTAAELRTAGMPAVAPPASFTATTKGSGFCLVAGAEATGTRFFAWSSAKKGLLPTAFATRGGALAAC